MNALKVACETMHIIVWAEQHLRSLLELEGNGVGKVAGRGG